MSWQDRFWRFVDKSFECWTWKGANVRGYGQLGVNGVNRSATRLSWEMANGPIPSGMFVCHHCDNPACVRPDHLFVGTPKQNTQDAVRKGRLARGSSISHSRLTAEQVVAIRALVDSGITQTECARRYGVSIAAVNYIYRRVTWRHVA